MKQDAEFHWLVGLLEGEGSFVCGPPSRPNCPRISVNMTDEDVIARCAKIFSRKYHAVASRNSRHKKSFTVILSGSRSVALMKELQPFMSIRRRGQIQRALDSYNANCVSERQVRTRKLHEAALSPIRERLKSGESLRAVARSLSLNHESLRRRLLA